MSASATQGGHKKEESDKA